MQYISPKIRADFCERVTLPDHASMIVENELLIMYFATTIFFDGNLLEYKVIYSTADQSFSIELHECVLDKDKFGLSKYAQFDQMFIDGLTTFLHSLVMCKGRDVDIPEERGSKVPHQHDLGVLDRDGTQGNRITRQFSHNCAVVMPFLREHENYMCMKCNHDLNRIATKDAEDGESVDNEQENGFNNESMTSDPLSTSAERSMDVEVEDDGEPVTI